MQKRNNKKWVRRIVMGIIIWMVMSMGLNAAFAINLQPKVEGVCPAGTVEIQGTGGSCAASENNDEITDCTKGVYIPATETCPKKAKTDTGSSQTAQEAISKLIAVIKAVEETLNKMLWPILFLIGGLLENDILFGGGMEQRLYDIWVPIRNIVNIIFVLTLVGLALYSVLGINSENSQYSIKTMLPKLIAGIIAVNFSFIGMKVFLDTVSVLTSAIFAIPAQIEETSAPVLGNDSPMKTQAFCKEVYGITTKKGVQIKNFDEVLTHQALLELAKQYGIPTTYKVETIKDVGTSLPGKSGERFTAELDRLKTLGLCATSGDGDRFSLSKHGEEYFRKYRSSNAALAMAINMGEVMFYDGAGSSLGSGSYESLAVNAIFSLLLYIVYGISFGVLFIVLLARLIVLWLGIALSPIIALSIAVPVAKEKFKMGELTQKFVAHAIAPITIALSMTIGWIMLTAIKSTMSGGGFAMSGSVLIPSVPIPGLETLQGLLVSIATVAVVWVGVFMAANETLAGTITEGIKSKVQQFGGWLATAPFKYVPWVPVETKDGGTTKLAPAGILNAAENVKSNIMRSANEKANKALGVTPVNAGLNNMTPTMKADDLSETVSNTKLEKDDATRDKLKSLKDGKVYTDLKTMAESGSVAGKKFATAMITAIDASDSDTLTDKHLKTLKTTANDYNKEREKAKEAGTPDASGTPGAGQASTQKAAEATILQDADLMSLIPEETAAALQDTTTAKTQEHQKALDQLNAIDDKLKNASEATTMGDEYDKALALLVADLKKTDKFKDNPAGAEEFAVTQMTKRTDKAPNKADLNIPERTARIQAAFTEWETSVSSAGGTDTSDSTTTE
jgi:hypothetical protein